MEFNSIVIILLVVVQYNKANLETLEDVLVYPLEAPSKIQKRETVGSKDTFTDFIEEKLIQHSQALEHLLKMVQVNEGLMKQLIENLSNNIEKPKMPEKVEVHRQNRRTNVIVEELEHPVVRIGRNIPKYGKLFKDIILKEMESETDPTPLVELDPEYFNSQFLSRRSFDDSPKPVAVLEDDNKVSPWCTIAMLCRRIFKPVCGFDENFGFGKFDDICHMLTVNCYWKYNFALVPSCKPTT